jgi:hypothetical protein
MNHGEGGELDDYQSMKQKRRILHEGVGRGYSEASFNSSRVNTNSSDKLMSSIEPFTPAPMASFLSKTAQRFLNLHNLMTIAKNQRKLSEHLNVNHKR